MNVPVCKKLSVHVKVSFVVFWSYFCLFLVLFWGYLGVFLCDIVLEGGFGSGEER